MTAQGFGEQEQAGLPVGDAQRLVGQVRRIVEERNIAPNPNRQKRRKPRQTQNADENGRLVPLLADHKKESLHGRILHTKPTMERLKPPRERSAHRD